MKESIEEKNDSYGILFFRTLAKSILLTPIKSYLYIVAIYYLTMDSRKFIATGRPVDRNYPTNRAISVITLVVFAGGIIYKLFSGEQLLHSLGWGFGVGFSCFFPGPSAGKSTLIMIFLPLLQPD